MNHVFKTVKMAAKFEIISLYRPPQNIPLAVPGDKNKKKPGIIYLSSIPPGFNVSCTIGFFSQFGKVGRVFLQPGIFTT